MHNVQIIIDHLILTSDGRGTLLALVFVIGMFSIIITDIIKSKLKTKRLREEGYNL